MLYDMIPNKVEEYIFLPYLKKLFEKCDKKEGYITFLKTIYPTINYTKGDISKFNVPLFILDNNLGCESYTYQFIALINAFRKTNDYSLGLPYYEKLITRVYVNVMFYDEAEDKEISDVIPIPYRFSAENSVQLSDNEYPRYKKEDIVGWIFQCRILDILKKPNEYKDFIDALLSENCLLYQEYLKARDYCNKLEKRTSKKSTNMFDLF